MKEHEINMLDSEFLADIYSDRTYERGTPSRRRGPLLICKEDFYMKKLIVLLLALAVAGAVSAQAAAPAGLPYSISGSASVKWGYDLDTKMSGFVNTPDWTLTIPLVQTTKVGASGKNVYGMIELADLDLSIVNDEAEVPYFDLTGATLTAKIFAGNAYVGIYSKPSFKFANANQIAPYYDANAAYSATSAVIPSVTVDGGVSLGYNLGTMGSAEFRLASLGDYTTANADNNYAFGVNTTLTPVAMLKVNAGAMMRSDDLKFFGLTGKVTVTPVDVMTLVVGADVNVDGANDKTTWDTNGSLTYAMNEKKDKISGEVYYAYQKVASPAKERLDAAVKFADVAGFVPGMTVDAVLYASDLLTSNDPLKLAFLEKVTYKIDLSKDAYVKPYESLGKNLADVSDDLWYAKVGVEAKLIPNTVFTLDYTTGKFNDLAIGNTFIGGKALAKGLLSFTTKISF